TSSFVAGAAPITLTGPNNLTGQVVLQNSGAGNAVQLAAASALNLGTSTVGGNLSLIADALIGSGTITVPGTLSIQARSGTTQISLGSGGAAGGLDLSAAQLSRFITPNLSVGAAATL